MQTLLIKFWREVIILALSGTVYFLYSRPEQVCPVAVKEDVKAATVEKVDTKQVVTTTIKKPDGTVVTKIVDTQKIAQVSQKSDDKKDVTSGPILSRYDIHVSRNINGSDYQLGAGARLGDSPGFATVDISFDRNFSNRSYFLGLRWEI